MKTYANIYYRSRMQAAQREPLHASRERTASEIFVSCEALADYETGRTVPPCDVVQKMVERLYTCRPSTTSVSSTLQGR